MSNGTILAVDDESLTLQMITDLLEDADFKVVTAANGKQAMEILMADPDRFDALVIDRNMPEMGGLEVLIQVRKQARTASIPVILQTVASSPQEMQEGIEAGAFYYITKPYDNTTLLAVVRSAVDEYKQNRQFLSFITADRILLSGIELLETGRFRFSTLTEAKAVVWMISQLTEETAMATACLTELLVNAIEHGNLGIDSAGKKELLQAHNWEEEINRRLSLPQNAQKRVQVEFNVINDEVIVKIQDQGQGFDWLPWLQQEGGIENRVQGRGIIIARTMSSHTLTYEDGGRRAIVRFTRL
jgi:DNA-binding response OmpR family regulator